MNGRGTNGKMVATKSKNKVPSCSTPDHALDSPSRDSDSMCDSDTASPIPFPCTQDGTEVVWNYYNTSSKSAHQKNSTPVSRKTRIPHRLKLPDKELQLTYPKRKVTRSQKHLEVPPELLRLSEFVKKLNNSKPSNKTEKPQSGSEEDIFNDEMEFSPKSTIRVKGCLRKNVLKTKFSKPEPENALDSDDSMNECLIKASQAVEENILKKVPDKTKSSKFNVNHVTENNLNDNSMDEIFKNIRSPCISRVKFESPGFNNDSFDHFVGNLNDSALERLSRMPVKNSPIYCKSKGQDISYHKEQTDASPISRFSFTRHYSMPESPSTTGTSRTNAATVPMGRYKSMPFDGNDEEKPGDSPIRCTPLEIQKKHQQAREKLLAKRTLPFTQTQGSNSVPLKQDTISKQTKETQKKFQVKHPSTTTIGPKKPETIVNPKQNNPIHTDAMDLRSLIERKRQEALMKLKRKQQQK